VNVNKVVIKILQGSVVTQTDNTTLCDYSVLIDVKGKKR